MSQVKLNTQAPEISLQDFKSKAVRLSDYYGKKNVVLVFNRTFT
ncbi:MAG: redoxin domain-containing protein [Anaerolineales bacterium]|nr:redoxin domain-containing protein [Anaerolineales bacterium]